MTAAYKGEPPREWRKSEEPNVLTTQKWGEGVDYFPNRTPTHYGLEAEPIVISADEQHHFKEGAKKGWRKLVWRLKVLLGFRSR